MSSQVLFRDKKGRFIKGLSSNCDIYDLPARFCSHCLGLGWDNEFTKEERSNVRANLKRNPDAVYAFSSYPIENEFYIQGSNSDGERCDNCRTMAYFFFVSNVTDERYCSLCKDLREE